MGIQAVFSNRVERLYTSLVEGLFSEVHNIASPFMKRVVIVPSPAMKSWVMQRLANDLGVASGIIVTYLEPALTWLTHTLAVEKPKPRQSCLSLAFSIEKELRVCANQKEHPLYKYLNDQRSLKLRGQQLASLADQLATLFFHYEKFGLEMLQEWAHSKKGGWQGDLWREVVGEVPELPIHWKRENVSVHLFGISFLSRQQHRYLMSLSEQISVSYYLLSPCQTLWSDVLSDKEGLKLREKWRRQGMDEEHLKEYEEWFFDRNPLLANWGKVGRMMAAEMEETFCQIEERYEERLCIEEDLTLLEAIQRDWLHLNNPTKSSPSFFKNDSSIQVHAASSKMREVEILYQILLHVIDKHSQDADPIAPQDIIVMAPDIMAYEPYIRAIFHSPESQLDCQIMDLNLFKQSEEVEGFFHLLNLPLSRWDAASLMQLLQCGSFRRKHHFSLEDIETIQEWINRVQIQWGEDRFHREEFLREAYGIHEMAHQPEEGTWKEGIDRLLLGMAMISPLDDETISKLSYFSSQEIPSSQQDLFGRWIAITYDLQRDLQPIKGEEKRTLDEWVAYLQMLLEKYFFLKSGEEFADELRSLIREFSKIEEIDAYPFASVQYHLEALAEKKRAGYREKHLHAVRCCSLLPMRAVPSKVIALLGMGEGCFPRQERGNPFNALAAFPKKDPCPSMADFDRYLFLESLLSCRSYFILTYASDASNGEVSPSLLITELLSYLDRSYLIEGALPSEKIFFRHPFHPFHRSYFEKDSPLYSYSESHYRRALAYYHPEKKKMHAFISDWAAPCIVDTLHERTIELKHLMQLSRDPIGFYFKERLGMYLKEEQSNETEERFLLSPKESALFSKRAIRTTFDIVKQAAEREGAIPTGPFKELSLSKMASNFQEFSSFLLKWGVQKETLYEIVCTDSEKTARFDGMRWLLPPLKLLINGKSVTLKGSLKDVCPSGLLCYQTGEKKELAKNWPQYLIFLALRELHQLPFGDQWLFLKSGESLSPWFESSIPYLCRYIEYYEFALKTPSPFIPDWVPYFFKDDISLQKQIQLCLKTNREHFYYDTLKWLSRGGDLPHAESLFTVWQPKAVALFGELYTPRG